MADNQNLTIEQSLAKLEEMLRKMESPEVSLEESFHFYQEGMKLLKSCGQAIDMVEKDMLQINGDGTFSEF